MKIKIFETKDCAWCEVCGRFVYARNKEELSNILDEMRVEDSILDMYMKEDEGTIS